MKSILVFIILFTIAFYSIGQEWVNISPFDYENCWVFADFISATEGWATGRDSLDNIILMHTTDGGESWDSLYSRYMPGQSYLVNMIDSEYGYMHTTESQNFFHRTTDGGHTWEDITDSLISGSNGLIASTISSEFISREIGFCSGRLPDSWRSTIYKTIDGGINWYPVGDNVLDSLAINESCRLNGIDFVDEMNGWGIIIITTQVYGIIKTTDGGESWCLLHIRMAGGIDMYNLRNGIVVGGSSLGRCIIVTNDGFSSILYDHSYDFPLGTPNYVCYQNDSIIWVTGSTENIVRSVDGGASFEIYQTISAPSSLSLNKIQFFDNIGYIAGDSNTLLKFEDTTSVAINEPYELHKKENLSLQSFPNPFNGETCITYNIEEAGNVELSIYNIKGQLVELLDNGFKEKGGHTITWDTEARGTNVASGIYFIKLNTKKESEITKILFLK